MRRQLNSNPNKNPSFEYSLYGLGKLAIMCTLHRRKKLTASQQDAGARTACFPLLTSLEQVIVLVTRLMRPTGHSQQVVPTSLISSAGDKLLKSN